MPRSCPNQWAVLGAVQGQAGSLLARQLRVDRRSCAAQGAERRVPPAAAGAKGAQELRLKAMRGEVEGVVFDKLLPDTRYQLRARAGGRLGRGHAAVVPPEGQGAGWWWWWGLVAFHRRCCARSSLACSAVLSSAVCYCWTKNARDGVVWRVGSLTAQLWR
jgi:hypothetical protein